jgi:hypothetical protein
MLYREIFHLARAPAGFLFHRAPTEIKEEKEITRSNHNQKKRRRPLFAGQLFPTEGNPHVPPPPPCRVTILKSLLPEAIGRSFTPARRTHSSDL